MSSTESGDLSKRVCLALDCYASTLHMQANTERLAGFRVGKLQELAWIEALRQEFAQQPAPDPTEALKEQNRRLRAAINQMAVRMDSRAEKYNQRNDGARAACWKNAADIVTEEMGRAVYVQTEAQP